ncbi:hypothetical protein IWQ60_009763 [Tieghemiomyces parasiticus]|uniref:DUF803-domain-containing protein n=1 Tax=Tieghemiomyces parasiticus TaxID=78921 RepID=A0A9W8DKM2_9FUNG|nr:hypothetical protein IWQ60_009829 [Tieghemiomyces parasiticus]KAJ1912207.1 hypothetical protein IWQ60_009763 [Tieghemiomyces parasiticus]
MSALSQEKYIGMGLALSSSALIGVSFVLTKKGLMNTSAKYGSAADSYNYFRNYLWWTGMILLGLGELANFAAYSFAPAVLVTPLGALSVIVGAILASVFLGEKITPTGKAGCALCLLGSIVIIIHAPEDGAIDSVDQIFDLVLRPWFLLYAVGVLIFSLVMIFKVAPKYGKTNPLIYISICSLVGSMTVIACKGFGVALKLTFAGNNQLTHVSTYVFALTVGLCIVVQMNYFNKALDVFSTNIVTPIYYVFFTTATIVASITLFRGFSKTDTVDITSLVVGFLTIFIGVFLLNSCQSEGVACDKTFSDTVSLREICSLDPGSSDSVGLLENAHHGHPSTHSRRESFAPRSPLTPADLLENDDPLHPRPDGIVSTTEEYLGRRSSLM